MVSAATRSSRCFFASRLRSSSSSYGISRKSRRGVVMPKKLALLRRFPQSLRGGLPHLGIAIVQRPGQSRDRGLGVDLAEALHRGQADVLVVIAQPVEQCLHGGWVVDIGDGVGGA